MFKQIKDLTLLKIKKTDSVKKRKVKILATDLLGKLIHPLKPKDGNV